MARVETTRLGINMPTELMKRLEDYASRMNISKTSAVCVLISQGLDNQKVIDSMSDLLRYYENQNK